MKYSEDLEIYKTKNGNYKIGSTTFYLKYCKECGEKCLIRKTGEYCSYKCSKTGKNHYNFGKKLSEGTKIKISKSNSGKNNSFYGKKHSDEIKQKISNSHIGKRHSEETKIKMSNSRKGKNNSNWKGDVLKLNISLFDTYAPQIEKYEEVRKSPDGYLEVKCTYCGKWYVPKTTNITSRINAINGKIEGECRFYCSKECKFNCPLFKKSPKTLMVIDAIDSVINNLDTLNIKSSPVIDQDLTREVQPELRKLVFQRDNWTCQKCGSTINLHCHHFEGILYNPIMSADIDLCITLCKNCHKEAHKDIGCRYHDLKCKK